MSIKKYKHIIFDIDGTLLNNDVALLHSLQDAIAIIKKGKPAIEDLRFALGIPGEETLKRLGVKDILKANELWNNILKNYNSQITLFDGIEGLLLYLKKKGYILGIITSKTRQEFRNDFVPFGISSFFDFCICVEDSPRPKPNPDPLLTYLCMVGISTKDAVYIGDSIYDLQCANNAGVDFGHAAWGRVENFSLPSTYIFNKPSEVIDLLEL